MKKILLLSLSIFILFACKKENPNNGFTVSGNLVSSNGAAASNVVVMLEGASTYQITTDNSGNFQLKGVERGQYNFSYKSILHDSLFTGNAYQLRITGDTNMSNLELPKPVIMYTPTNISSNGARLSWSKCTASGFYEYKLFRKSDDGLDESTGTLIHVATSASDTVFTDNSAPDNAPSYYRLYVMNNYGKLGGSNIVNVHTLGGNYALNGSFESYNSLDSTATDWSYTNNFIGLSKVISDTSAPDGQRCLFVDLPAYHYALSFGDMTQVHSLDPAIRYELSVWVKVIDFGSSGEVFIECYDRVGYRPETRIDITSTVQKNVWKKYTTQFYGSSLSMALQIVTMSFQPPFKMLVDDIVLRKAP